MPIRGNPICAGALTPITAEDAQTSVATILRSPQLSHPRCVADPRHCTVTADFESRIE